MARRFANVPLVTYSIMKRSFAPRILTAPRVGHQENPDTETWTLTLNSIVREKAQKISPSRNEELVKIDLYPRYKDRGRILRSGVCKGLKCILAKKE